MSVLAVKNLRAGYGQADVLQGISVSARPGEVVALLGRNGAGRTTLLKAIMGLVERRDGSIHLGDVRLDGMPAHSIAMAGVGYCPEERAVFGSLSCEENLLLPPAIPAARQWAMSLTDIYRMFPNLEERRHSPGGKLSGGEQQMLAVARILRTGARLLLLDEISEGLAPVIVQALGRLISSLKEKGYTIILVEQNYRFAAPLCDRFYVIERGQVSMEFTQADRESRRARVEAYLAV